MNSLGHSEVRFELEPGPQAPGVARRRVLEAVAPWDGVELDTLALLTSELVTNAVLHAGTPAVVTVRVGRHNVRVEVSDSHPGQPELRQVATEAVTGRGLHIVDALADRWGFWPSHDGSTSEGPAIGKTVWFELDRGEARR